MRTAACLLAATLGLAIVGSAQAAADVGVSISISQPGVYGRVDIGRFPQPALYVQQPVLVRQVMVPQPVQPAYLWVPPGHRKNWRQHCGRYGACGTPVYFVHDDWYRDHVTPHKHGDRRGDRRDDWRGPHGKGHGKHD